MTQHSRMKRILFLYALRVAIARDMPAVKMVLELYRTAGEAFDPFVQDFVREQLYPQIRDHAPSSTKLGRDALFRRIQQNKELFRVDYSDYGEAESLLADYLAGDVEFSEVVRVVGASGRTSIQRQEVREDQVGTVEQEFPGIVEAVPESPPANEFEAASARAWTFVLRLPRERLIACFSSPFSARS